MQQPVIIPTTATTDLFVIRTGGEMAQVQESGSMEVAVEKECGVDSKGVCRFGAMVTCMGKLGLEQYNQYPIDYKKGWQEEYNAKTPGLILNKCCFKTEDHAGGLLASWTIITPWVGEGQGHDCKQIEFRWHAIVGYCSVTLNVIMDGADDAKAKAFIEVMIIKAKAINYTTL